MPIPRPRTTHPLRLAALFVAFAACLAAVAIPAAASPGDRLDEIRHRRERINDRIDRATERSGSLKDRLGSLDNEAETIQATVSDLDARLNRLDSHITRVRDQLTTAQQHLTALTEELLDIQARLVERTDVFTERAVEAYKAGPSAPLDGLLSAQSFNDFVDRYEYYESALDADTAILDEIDALRSATEQRRDDVEAEKDRIAHAKLQLENDRAAVATVRASKQEALDAQNALIAEKQDILKGVLARRSNLEKVDAQLEADSQRIQSLLASAGSTTPGPTGTTSPGGTGQLAWPASGPITSGYGYRTHPIFGTTTLHAGIDIGAAYGSAVWAADTGTVSYVGTMSGYGNVVVVDHGGGMATLYAHLSAFSVGSGQSVGRGQQIANVGCTGYCTGPHLHFEVRINGSPVDPMPYLQ